MDIDFRWGGDPSIVLAVEAALVASIPIQVRPSYVSILNFMSLWGIFKILIAIVFSLQLKDLQVFTIIRVIFQLAEEIPCISAVVVALLAEVNSAGYSFVWNPVNQPKISERSIDLKLDMHVFTSWLCCINYFVVLQDEIDVRTSTIV